MNYVEIHTLFGAYYEVQDKPEVTNNIMQCTHEAIAMGPTGNLQVSYKFLCMETGSKIVQRWRELPLLASIV